MGKWVQAENMKLEKGEERDRGNISMLRAPHHNKKQWLGWGIEEGMQMGMPTWSCVPTEHPILDQGSVLAGRWCLGQFSSAGGRREQRVPVIILSKGEPACPLREMSPFGS